MIHEYSVSQLSISSPLFGYDNEYACSQLIFFSFILSLFLFYQWSSFMLLTKQVQDFREMYVQTFTQTNHI